MVTELSLFPDLAPVLVPAAEPVEQLSYGRRLTLRHQAAIANGRHPIAGTKLDPDPEHRCGNCDHLVRNTRNKTYLKCGLIPLTRGPGTDLRAKWPACTRWEPSTSDESVSGDAARWRP